jgi:hypothetical protein
MAAFYAEDEVVLLVDIPELNLMKGRRAEVIESNDDSGTVTVEYYNEATYAWTEVEVPASALAAYVDE